jgi:predicted secreted acid phosphatase
MVGKDHSIREVVVRGFTSLRRSRRLTVAVLAGLLALGAVALASPSLPIVAPTPKHADDMTNVDVLRQEIKNYYGMPTAPTGPNAPKEFALNLDSNYAREASHVADEGGHWLKDHAKGHGPKHSAMRAIVLDVDDSTLATFNYELFSNWDFNPGTNADFVLNERFPAVPGMVDMVDQAAGEGYAIIWLTGRPQSQEAATLGNLLKVDYPSPSAIPTATQGGGSDGIFTKPPLFLDPPTNSVPNPDYPQYLKDKCGTQTTCNTDEYKSATRQYIESLGYDIVANFGDQFSDFSGGFEDKTFKLPNPSYFLP